MRIVLYIISVLWIVTGTLLIIYTESTREFLKRAFLIERIRWLAFLPLVFGAVLVVGAFYQRQLFWLAIILGGLGIIKGIYLTIGPVAQIRTLMDWWFHKADERTIRLHGLITFILGAAIFSYLR
jgi:hypothetical protein